MKNSGVFGQISCKFRDFVIFQANIVKSGHFVSFSYIGPKFSGKNICSLPPKLTQLLRFRLTTAWDEIDHIWKQSRSVAVFNIVLHKKVRLGALLSVCQRDLKAILSLSLATGYCSINISPNHNVRLALHMAVVVGRLHAGRCGRPTNCFMFVWTFLCTNLLYRVV